ncbi:type II toxin-antitoxin system HicB family antitoxin [Streptococcus himalayensis]|uniref:HicB family protein n=1 Tax=Streptococcus himalayensis TaxID=1888195 RepID=A0A917AA48_9STRE|nr:type II toxin-antitoxin system HicB family antitoxin [Streptococcus himalayensis]GGE38243.1 HicB family protein [Streptococcus himalayensis]
MLVTYPALFYYDDTDGTNVPYFVHFPDIDGSGTQGTSLSDAMAMASDWLGIHLAHYIENGQDLPQSSDINSLSLDEDAPFKDEPDFLSYDPEKSFVSLVMVDVAEYLGNQEPIKKTLTIPRWADKLGRELGLNFSQTLTEAIADKKIQA